MPNLEKQKQKNLAPLSQIEVYCQPKNRSAASGDEFDLALRPAEGAGAAFLNWRETAQCSRDLMMRQPIKIFW